MSANPEFKILKSPSNTQSSKPFSTKKIAITKYPMGEQKRILFHVVKVLSYYN